MQDDIVIIAAKSVVKRRPELAYLFDDFVGVGYLKLAQVGDLNRGHAYAVARNAMIDFARREKRQTFSPLPDHHPAPRRLPEVELVARENNCLDAILACCRDDIDRAIIAGRQERKTITAIAAELGLSKGAVSKRRAAIFRRFHQK